MAKVPGKRGSQLHKDWHNLCSEFNLCKRKLQAKTEGLLVLAKELDNVRQEKDAYKLMAEQLREKYHGQKKKYDEREKALGLSLDENDPLSERRSQSLAQILCETREQNRKAELEIKELRQKLTESEGDMRILRENIARQRVGDEGVGMRHFPAHERETLVAQLEAAREQVENLERDMVAKIDELQEHVTERDFFRHKADHLNEELNYVLGGNEKRIVDIDAMLMENKYLKERLSQAQEEKSHAQAIASKYKGVLEKRKGRGIVKSSSGPGSLVLSQKQVENLLGAGSLPVTSATITDLHSLSRALLETIHDKNVAINHQRNTNKILGKRVEELENKLKTLEVAGLWNLPPARTAAMQAWRSKMSPPDLKETLVPRQVSLETTSSDQSGGSISGTPQHHASKGASAETVYGAGEELRNGLEVDLEQSRNVDLEESTGDADETAGTHEKRSESIERSQGDSEIGKDNFTELGDSVIGNDDLLGWDSGGPESSDRHGEVDTISEVDVKGSEDEREDIGEGAGLEDDQEEVKDDILQEGDSPRSMDGDAEDTPADDPHGQSAENINVLETLFDTVAEKLAKDKSTSQSGGVVGEAGKANTKTPLLPSQSQSKKKEEPTPERGEVSAEKEARVIVDTTPQCV